MLLSDWLYVLPGLAPLVFIQGALLCVVICEALLVLPGNAPCVCVCAFTDIVECQVECVCYAVRSA